MERSRVRADIARSTARVNNVPIRILFDVNVFISAFLFGGLPRKAYDAVEIGPHLLLTSREILTELRSALGYEKLRAKLETTQVTAEEIVIRVLRVAQIVSSVELPADSVRDQKDIMVLAAAVGGQADFLVTGDKDLTSLGTYQLVKIVTPAQLLQILPPGS